MREMWLAYKYQENNLKKKIDLKKCFMEYVKSGQPFEIIDGDNNESLLKYIYPLMTENQKSKTACITILGP